MKTDPEKGFGALKAVGAQPAGILATAARIPAPPPSEKTSDVTIIPAFSKGWVEVQDLGSQIAAAAAGDIAGKQVLDYCAGGGGKSLALAAMMRNRGQLYAFDADPRRLKPIYERASRAGVRNLQIVNPLTDMEALSALKGRIDVVLVDAPCTGSGVWRRHPDSKWRLTPEQLATRMQEQLGFSKDSLELVKERLPQLIDMTLQLLPGLLFLTFGFIALINILSLRRRFPERRTEWFAVENFRDWKAPEPLVWGLIACGFSVFFPVADLARLIAMNLLLIVGAFYFAQGLAVIAFFFHKNNVPRFLRGITYILIVFQQIFTLMVVGLGLFDLWGDFRRLGKDNLTSSQAS